MIVYVTALFECGWCGVTAIGAKPEAPESEPTTPPAGWRFVYSTERRWPERKKGISKLAICMHLMDVMCGECRKQDGKVEGKYVCGFDSETNDPPYPQVPEYPGAPDT